MTRYPKTSKNFWNILIVDDIKDIHTITRNAFFEEQILGLELNFLSATTEKEAINMLDKYNEEISVIILDMALEHNGDEGVNVLDHMVNKLKNLKTQVILRTGYPGKPEVININKDFPHVVLLEKGETENEDLILMVTKAITRYNNI